MPPTTPSTNVISEHVSALTVLVEGPPSPPLLEEPLVEEPLLEELLLEVPLLEEPLVEELLLEEPPVEDPPVEDPPVEPGLPEHAGAISASTAAGLQRAKHNESRFIGKSSGRCR